MVYNRIFGAVSTRTFGVTHIIFKDMDSESLEQPDVSANDKEHLSSESEQAGGAGGAESNVEG